MFMKKENVFDRVFIFCVLASLLTACATNSVVTVEGEGIKILFDQNLKSKVVAKFDNREINIGDYAVSEYLDTDANEASEFTYVNHSSKTVEDNIGKGKQYQIVGENPQFQKTITVTLYADFPSLAIYDVEYKNKTESEITVTRWTNNNYSISSGSGDARVEPFWTYQSGSYESRPDWVLPIKAGFKQDNYMGMNNSDYGGGTPVSDIWRRDAGIGVGHLEVVPKLVSLPVAMPDDKAANLGVTREVNKTLKGGESLNTLTTFVAVHQGDYFATLDTYRQMMVRRGIKFDEWRDSVYEPVWCAWGYRREFTMPQVYGTLPKVKELGYQWAVLDDGWQTAEGDWFLHKGKFPRGDIDMQKFVKTINANDLKAKLWWAPMAVDPGTDLIKNHPEYLLLNEDGSTQDITWWDSYYLCPAYAPVQEFTKNQVTTIMQKWGYAGLKIDGQHLNGAPPCYNQAHNHAYPEESVEKVPEFFKTIYETALKINADAVVEICPCGTAYSFFNLPYMNQPVSSDPTSSWQIRHKGKTLKALMGPNAPYYGDHVELSDGKNDFASTVGIGGIVGSKFTWPVGAMKDSRNALTHENEEHWAKWNQIYLNKMLPKGDYLGRLYDIGFDKPETHAVSKDGKMYYAFYADSWQGEVELRGLGDGAYKVVNYVTDSGHGSVTGPVARLEVDFKSHLLLEAIPE